MKKSKFNEIDERIKTMKDKSKVNKKNTPQNSELIFNIAVEFVAAIIVGLLVGLFLDNLLASNPLFLIMSVMLSCIAAMKSLWRRMNVRT